MALSPLTNVAVGPAAVGSSQVASNLGELVRDLAGFQTQLNVAASNQQLTPGTWQRGTYQALRQNYEVVLAGAKQVLPKEVQSELATFETGKSFPINDGDGLMTMARFRGWLSRWTAQNADASGTKDVAFNKLERAVSGLEAQLQTVGDNALFRSGNWNRGAYEAIVENYSAVLGAVNEALPQFRSELTAFKAGKSFPIESGEGAMTMAQFTGWIAKWFEQSKRVDGSAASEGFERALAGLDVQLKVAGENAFFKAGKWSNGAFEKVVETYGTVLEHAKTALPKHAAELREYPVPSSKQFPIASDKAVMEVAKFAGWASSAVAPAPSFSQRAESAFS